MISWIIGLLLQAKIKADSLHQKNNLSAGRKRALLFVCKKPIGFSQKELTRLCEECYNKAYPIQKGKFSERKESK